MKIGAQLYTIRDFIQTPEDIKVSLKKIRDIGYESVQVSGMGPIDPQELRDIADGLGLKLLATHIPFESMQNDMDTVIKNHKIMGCKYAGVGGLPVQYRNKDGYKKFAGEFDEITKKLNAAGIKTTYHNHNFEFEKFDDKTGIDILLENSSQFLFLIDTYWIQAGGGDVVDWIYKLKDRIEIVHFKDMGFSNNTQVMKEIYEGNLNWKGIIKACEDIGVTYAFVEQDNCNGRDPFESLKISFDNLKKAGI